MERLYSLLDKHLDNSKVRLTNLPLAQRQKGGFEALHNMLGNAKIYAENAESIVNSEYKDMIDFINDNWIEEYTDEQIEEFQIVVKERFTELLQDGLRNSMGI